MNRRTFVTEEIRKEIIRISIEDNSCFFLHLNGKDFHTEIQYFAYLYKYLRLPISFSFNLDAYLDMMTDPYSYSSELKFENGKNNNFPNWGDVKKIVILIDDYDNFLKQNKIFKKEIEDLFDNDILPFFKNEIEEVYTGGYKIEYSIYCYNGLIDK